MDAYEATRVVMARIQALDPENAAKIMGLLLIQDHGEKEMIRLALGPESLLHSVVLKARKELGLSTTTPCSPAAAAGPPSPFLISRQNSSSRLLSPLSVSSPTSWAPPPPFSRSNDELQGQDELISPGSQNPSPFYSSGDLIDDFQLQDQLSFLNDPNAAQGNGDAMGLPYSGLGWGGAAANGYHRRSCSMAELCLGSDGAAGVGFGWKPCLYFARGYCKNGTNCRFLHGLPDDSPTKMDSVVEQQCHELFLRSKSQRLMASAFPYLPSNALPQSPTSSSGKCVNFLLQQQQSDSQRAAATAAALMLGGDESHKFISRSRLERTDFASLVNPGSRQIYLTFPADSTFREEDVSKYFSSYGPVQDVRIPYQQKRMFGFVTFVYPETVKLILAKGNPHFVCDARVLVKPYKEKGKVPDKYRKQQQGERGDFPGCTTPTGLVDARDPYELQQLGAGRLLYGGAGAGGGQEAMLRRRLEEQQQVAELQQAIELQSRRFMGLQLLDLKSRTTTPIPATTQEEAPPLPPPEDKSPSCAAASAAASSSFVSQAAAATEQQSSVNSGDKEESPCEGSPNEDSGFQESNAEHNLPDSPFASPTKASSFAGLPSVAFSDETISTSSTTTNHLMSPTLIPQASTLDMASFKSCFFQMPRFSSGHGAVGM